MDMRNVTLCSAIAVVSIALSSCERDRYEVEDLFSLHSIPEYVKDDFLRRTGDGAVLTDAFNNDSNGLIELYYEDVDGDSHKCQYCDGIWQMDAEYFGEENFDSMLPRTVKRTYYNLDVDGEIRLFPDWRDGYYKIKRRGIEHDIYEFYFHYLLPDNSWYQSYAQICADGELLIYSHLSFNRSDFFYNFDDAFNLINSEYPGCEIRGYANEVGDNVFYARHDGILKKVVFRNNYKQFGDIRFAWKETIWPLAPEAVIPESVLERAKDINYTSVLFKETPYQGNYYGFVEGDTTHWLAER